ncbi:MAG: DNA repair exonuclease [Ruminococcaceae bacterium]|nr:DNA repair exonuclease [Oscillospiraceae bacterium]
MKLIHCADLHLDSPMETNLPPDRARERKAEILSTFAKLVRLADEGGVSGILIAGDLFDSNHVTKKTERYVLDLIASHPDLYFFYLAGNHDRASSLRLMADKPENLCTFDDGWRSYQFGEVTVTGSERPDPDTLSLDPDAVNIVLMHGQEGSGRGEESIRFSRLKGKHIDYLALGHLHEYRTAQIDARCTACYAGCLEGRGFDECGQKGYVLLEADHGKLTHRFAPIARRTLHTVHCDVTGYTSQLDLENRLLDAVREIPASDLVKAVLTGSFAGEAQFDLSHLGNLLSERFYFAKLRDETRLLINPDDYRHDISLKGEFVRRVMASSLPESEKERVIACGFRALMGEEVGL